MCHTGADWNDSRDEFRRLREMPVLVQCEHCNAPSDFHIQLALFKEYYEEVFDMVRDGRVTLYDLRRSVTVVSYWPPRPNGVLLRRLSVLASQVSDALGPLVTDTFGRISSLVMEYWQGVTQDYLSQHSKFVYSLDMYNCNHLWPCDNNETVTRPCLWMRWSQHWVHELHVCDSRSYQYMNEFPLTWQAWVDQRLPDWHFIPDGLPYRIPTFYPVTAMAPWGMFDSYWEGDDFLKMAACHPFLSPTELQDIGPYVKKEHRTHDTWYNRALYPLSPDFGLGGMKTEALTHQLSQAARL